ncbi:MAG: hypothetical protein HC828_03675, partial [Blastochloris sp.]|nr:hypothetical protein [Blastochloris sp.]
MTTEIQPYIPPDLPGWKWQRGPGDQFRLVNAADGWVTAWAPDTHTLQPIAEAYTITNREQALVAEAQAKDTPAPPANTTRLVEFTKIRKDGGTQARDSLNEAVAQEYAETWIELSRKPNGLREMQPIVLYYDGTDYWIGDGFHRTEGYQLAYASGQLGAAPAAILAEVRQGTRRDAMLHAAGANAQHGLRRTRADVRRAIEMLLRDDEWRQWSNREIADRVKCDHKTVGAVRTALEQGGEIPHLTERKGADGKTYAAAPAAPAWGPNASPEKNAEAERAAVKQYDYSIATGITLEALERIRIKILQDDRLRSEAAQKLIAILDTKAQFYRPVVTAAAQPSPSPVAPPADFATVAIPTLTVGRETLGKDRLKPITPWVLIVGDRRSSYEPAAIHRAEAVYETQSTVRVRLDGSEETKAQHKVYAVPTEEAWTEAQRLHQVLADTLTALADGLRDLGRYDTRLDEAGGLKAAPNPLTPTIISCKFPEDELQWWWEPWQVTNCERKLASRHTAKMVFYQWSADSDSDSSAMQHQFAVCPDDAAWERIAALHAAAEAARAAFVSHLATLGTYQDALADGRYMMAASAVGA